MAKDSPNKRTWQRSPTLRNEETPASVCSDAVRWKLAVAGAKMAAFAELKVKRCCSLLVGMLAVVERVAVVGVVEKVVV